MASRYINDDDLSSSMANLNLEEVLIECPVCFESIGSTPIYQCPNGHVACKECFPKLSECPSCREPLGNRRNNALEQMVEKLKKIKPIKPSTPKPKSSSNGQQQQRQHQQQQQQLQQYRQHQQQQQHLHNQRQQRIIQLPPHNNYYCPDLECNELIPIQWMKNHIQECHDIRHFRVPVING